MTEPLVTIGVPTFDRPAGLARTLESLRFQTWKNLEIVVSNNASTLPEVELVALDAMAKDSRVTLYSHQSNIGMMPNFSSLIFKGAGEFFMWAADDDRWEPFFIERCMHELMKDSSLIVCQMEAQYELEDGSLFPFFAEGRAFYDTFSGSRLERLQHLTANVFGNLVYGVFRREALIHQGRPVTEWIGQTLNEIPMQILLAAKGGIRMLPEVGMYKVAPLPVCEQARWEQEGGPLPNWPGAFRHVQNIIALRRYHQTVSDEVFTAIESLGLEREAADSLKKTVTERLRGHLVALCMRRKPSRARNG